jgi:hypothetical protein
VNMIKNIIFSLCVLNSFQLFPMTLELYKKSDDDSGLMMHYFLLRQMEGYSDEKHIRIPKDVVTVIAQKSYLVRKKEIYTKFNPFFRFDNESYFKIKNDWMKNRGKFIDEHPGDLGDDDVKKFHELYPDNAHLICRQFNTIEPDDLLFFTQKQDEILSKLINRPKCFHNDKGYFSLQLTQEENEQYVMLPNKFQEKLDKYPKFVRIVFIRD